MRKEKSKIPDNLQGRKGTKNSPRPPNEMETIDDEMREFEREVKAIDFRDPHMRGDGRWDWSDEKALKAFLTPDFTYKTPTPTKKRLLYSEFLIAMLGDVSQTTDVVDLMMKVIYLSPNPGRNQDLLFPNLFDDQSANEIYNIPEAPTAESLALLLKPLKDRYKDALVQFGKTWTAPVLTEEEAKQVQLEKKRTAGTAPIDPEGAVDRVTTEIQKTVKKPDLVVVTPAATVEKALADVNAIWSALHHDPPTEATTNAHQMLGFMALICSRLCVKETSQVQRYFQTRATKAYIGTCNPRKLALALPVPCPDFLRQVAHTFPKGSLRQRELFSYLVGARRAYDYIAKPVEGYEPSQIKCGYLDAGCLIHLSMNGLGLISLLLGTSYELGAPIGWILQAITDSIAVNSARVAMKFLKTYHSLTRWEMTWQWSRLIDDSNFTNLALRNHIIFGSRLAAIYMLKSKDQGIWEMLAFSKLSDGQKNAATEWGRKVVNYSQSLKGEVGYTALMKDIQKHGSSFVAPHQPTDDRRSEDERDDEDDREPDGGRSDSDDDRSHQDPTETKGPYRGSSPPPKTKGGTLSFGVIIPGAPSRPK